MMPWWLLLLLDGATMFVITTGTTLGVVLLEVGKGETLSWTSIVAAIVAGLVACSQQLRARLALPPPSTAMVAAAAAAAAPLAAANAAPAAAAAAIKADKATPPTP